MHRRWDHGAATRGFRRRHSVLGRVWAVTALLFVSAFYSLVAAPNASAYNLYNYYSGTMPANYWVYTDYKYTYSNSMCVNPTYTGGVADHVFQIDTSNNYFYFVYGNSPGCIGDTFPPGTMKSACSNDTNHTLPMTASGYGCSRGY